MIRILCEFEISSSASMTSKANAGRFVPFVMKYGGTGILNITASTST